LAEVFLWIHEATTPGFTPLRAGSGSGFAIAIARPSAHSSSFGFVFVFVSYQGDYHCLPQDFWLPKFWSRWLLAVNRINPNRICAGEVFPTQPPLQPGS
jgi:hypothetical protein